MNTHHSELPNLCGLNTNELQKLLATPELNFMNFALPKDMLTQHMSLFPDPNLTALIQLQMGILPMMQPMQHFNLPLLPNPAMDLTTMFNNSLLMKMPPTTLAAAAHLPCLPELHMPSPSTVQPMAVQMPLTSPPERRRKRSRASAEPQRSILRQLCEDDDVEVIKIQKAAAEDTSLRMRTHSLCITKKTEEIKNIPSLSELRKPLRRIMRDQDLPETVGPDSPFRHHPKYQKRSDDPDAERYKDYETIAALVLVQGYMPKELQERALEYERAKSQSPKETPVGSPKSSDSPKRECPMQEFMEQVISRELVICE